MDKIQVATAYQDADEFRAWWDADAARLAEVIRKIGKVEPKGAFAQSSASSRRS